MSIKQSIVKTFAFDKTWQPPQGSIKYVHLMEFENGDRGSVWCNTNMPTAYSPGAHLSYSIPAAGRIKIESVLTPQNNPTQPPMHTPKQSNNAPKSDLFAHAWTHAKDIVIAKMEFQSKMAEIKSTGNLPAKARKEQTDDLFMFDPLQELFTSAELIYNKMKEMRDNEFLDNNPPVSEH